MNITQFKMNNMTNDKLIRSGDIIKINGGDYKARITGTASKEEVIFKDDDDNVIYVVSWSPFAGLKTNVDIDRDIYYHNTIGWMIKEL